ncbi:unnamed protein product [Prorocentrum cordatum]|uniref:VWFA domain-containing protein n=1 Tax=Prorocentrum cordatum TaxID=2364126 RepID=A0ABN9UJI5_9DINO|nr:unnamed protein product [Polarella glacialis]
MGHDPGCVTEGMAPCSGAVAPAHEERDVDNLRPLLRELRGKLGDGAAAQAEHPGGLPRGWAALRSFSDVLDADLGGAAVWCESPGPHLPRVQRRVRRRLGGRVAIIRDTSLSMRGPYEIFASMICSKVIELAKQFRMHVGYLEFNDDVLRFVLDKSRQFFSREYATLLRQVRWARSKGCTNYEVPLNVALSEFRGMRGMAARCNQHILFLTDGHPNRGDPSVARQLASARSLGVSIRCLPGLP